MGGGTAVMWLCYTNKMPAIRKHNGKTAAATAFSSTSDNEENTPESPKKETTEVETVLYAYYP